ncbi:NAD(P)/FAD-dependent oxidoreductase [Methylobacterium sp. R2-1]|uniref:flavin-containing monooxygenase n=1 Tax=Methylobacterium sp. R2-1 TaxID=2587064 RepID=UPI0016177E53|nr:NAD(P)-binding domain-containing protein [Methylobacterium sp. R2-1]MBB2964258.1 cation diffusion facilitator CzcD-associated flavoprotein CzcO [Methylobacterium sp. R2-1]
MRQERIGIIGAGASGIGIAKALRREGIEFDLLESTSRVGGNWQPDGPASKMYRSAHLISSKRNTQFSDYPMPDSYPHYPHHSLMHGYLESVVASADVQRNIRFDTTVTSARHDGSGWRLRFKEGGDAFYGTLIVCSGLLRRPSIPFYPGRFDGETIHAVEYRSSSMLDGKRVLVVGGGNSGCDIAVDAVHGAAKVFHSTRRGYHYMPKFIAGRPTQEWLMDIAPEFSDPDAYWEHVTQTFRLAGFDGRDFGLPPPDHGIQSAHPILNSQILFHIGHGDISPVGDIVQMSGRGIEFSDGKREEIDIIIWATGYDPDLPFFNKSDFDAAEDLKSAFLKVASRRYDDLLYVGYLNTPSGLGNVGNVLGSFTAAYLQGRAGATAGWQKFQLLKRENAPVDLGQERFMRTKRHSHEVDLWKFIKTMNFLSAKLRQ